MWRRSTAGSLLVLLAALSVVETAVETATHRIATRHQWQDQKVSQGTVRVPHRTLATFSDPAVVAVVNAVGSALALSLPRRASPSPARVFVPPRV